MMEDIKSGKDGVSYVSKSLVRRTEITYLMFLYLNFPDLEEMRQMYLQHYK